VTNRKKLKIGKGGKIIENTQLLFIHVNKPTKKCKINGIIRRYFVIQMSVHTKRSLRNITQRESLHFGSQNFVIKQKRTQELSVAQMRLSHWNGTSLH
jgi:hypothetical protein